MDEKTYPNVESFVIRFVMDQSPPEDQVGYRGVIRHVQTDEELGFTDFQEAIRFINKFVPIDMDTHQKGDVHAT